MSKSGTSEKFSKPRSKKALMAQWPEGKIIQALFITENGTEIRVECGLGKEAFEDILKRVIAAMSEAPVPGGGITRGEGRT